MVNVIKSSDSVVKPGVPVIKIGDSVYQTDGIRIYESRVRKIIYDTEHIAFDEDAIGKTIFLSRDEAERELQKGVMVNGKNFER